MKRLVAPMVVAVVALAVASSLHGSAVVKVVPSEAATRPAATASHPVHVNLVIATPDMLGTQDLPAYIPSDMTLPANSEVVVTVTNFDDATPLTGGLTQFAVPTGIVGKLSIQPLDPTHPNAPAAVQTASALDPQSGVAHTFTIPKLHINVPIAPKSKETFTIRTGKAGTYTWQCFDPCGTGASGWGGAMATPGYMQGKVTIA